MFGGLSLNTDVTSGAPGVEVRQTISVFASEAPYEL